MALAVAGLAYLAAYGARTPLLALRGLLRLRNVALILVPAVAMAVVALALEGRVDDRVSQGALAIAVVPAPLVAPGLVGRTGRRGDLAGALVLGTVLVSLLVIGSRGALASAALFAAAEAFALAAMLANALPRVRDALLTPLRWIGWAAGAAVVALALFPLPLIDGAVVLVAFALCAVGGGSAAAVALVQGRDPVAAAAGAGLRDPILATALASVAFAQPSVAIPLAYGVFCLGLGALSLRAR